MGKIGKCPLCRYHRASCAEVTVRSTGKTYYAVRCGRDECRLSCVPDLRHCHETEAEAVREWNEMGARR